MFLETIKSQGLAHLSYLFGADGEAAVVDPRRDCEIYVEKARAQGCRIRHIFETHRNEDLLSGAAILARLTGAAVHHGPDADGEVVYARTVREGDCLGVGPLEVRVLETPGHTDDSISLALFDRNQPEGAVAVFTGDALFIGDVGRTDFYPERAREVAGLLHDSLQRILALGDQAIVCPAHGAGSVCGGGLAEREFSTLGHERANNPMLQIADREAFIDRKVAERHLQPPYFRAMEQGNLEGASAMARIATPAPLDAAAFEKRRACTATLDLRGITAWLGGHLPASLAMPVAMVPAFAGWLLDPADDLLLVAEDAGQAEAAWRHLGRIGFDRVVGYLDAGLPAWAAGGHGFGRVAAVDTACVAERVARGDDGWCLLDVRDDNEVARQRNAGSRHIYAGKLPRHLEELDPDRHYTVMCASGARATIAASVLCRAGFSRVDVYLGSMGAWTAAGLPTDD